MNASEKTETKALSFSHDYGTFKNIKTSRTYTEHLVQKTVFLKTGCLLDGDHSMNLSKNPGN